MCVDDMYVEGKMVNGVVVNHECMCVNDMYVEEKMDNGVVVNHECSK